ncbi:hypothetical protein SSX86_008920 [Deinandra increscens subsp. villosa]|uniref:Uncharacterized protein n=1 Tax=Deinandra increscens subsp. villosa TaxID=3103831 RepID=A0AAP0DDK4_9ASTR
MESGLRSRKRKQSSSKSDDPFGGIFTRSRSQMYFHRHRSGYARSDSNRSRNLIKSVKGRDNSPVKQPQSEDRVDLGASQVSVIDLRARRVFSPATIADDVVSMEELDLEAGSDVCKKNVSFSEGDLGVSESVAIEVDSDLENIGGFSSVREKDVVEVDVVQMAPIVAESEQNKRPEEKKNEIISASIEIADTKGFMNKSQSSVASLRGRKKVFKSPSSFSYRRMLPYLTDLGNDDSPSFEIVETALPKVLKSTNTTATMETGPVSNYSKLADELMNDEKRCEKQNSYSVNDGLISTSEGSDVGQRSQEDALNDTLACEQMTPPDSDIRSKSKIDDIVGVPVNPQPKPALKPCSRKKVLQTPTSFSHRRLLPFLMSVAEDYSCSVKSNQSVKPLKPTEQNQQPPTKSLLHQDEKSTTTDETSNSPTSTLIPVDTSFDITKSITVAPNDNNLDANGLDKEGRGLVSPLDVSLQGEAVKSDSSIKLEQSPPKISLKCVEETTSIATPLCIEQSYSEDHHITVKERPHQITVKESPHQITVKESPHQITLKESPHQITVKESPHQITVKESPHQHLLQITETHGDSIKNGILKRTPRGCRGICNCLNCTSFRLHAERSFEFSKNQMHDAEEVALELINDLTCLRNILETTSSLSNSLDSVKEKQVKEACAKALYKEQVARARLAHMNEDLSIHCRSMTLFRPKVTFANKIEEKVISKNDIYGRKSV